MRRLPCGRVALLLTGLVLASLPSAGFSDPPKPQKIVFESVDKVALQGTWYPSANEGTKSPCVLLLHKIGGNRQQEGWETLAQALQEKGLAVLSFDFRGHGDSRNIRAAEFWSNRANLNNIKGATKKQETIDHEKFLPGYFPYLANDIAAAKVFLEQKNNAKECNSGELYIVGAEDGAGLGLVWAASEWMRRKLAQGPNNQTVPFPDPEGKEIGAIVCLSLRDVIGNAPKGNPKLPYTSIFQNPSMKNTPICFFSGKEDEPNKKFATTIYDKTLNAENPKAKLKLTFNIGLNTKLAGHELLGKAGLGTEANIAEYIGERVRATRVLKPWAERDVPVEGRPTLNPLREVPLQPFGLTVR